MADYYCSGFEFQLREVDKEDLEEAILSANDDDKVDGIIVYFPVFGGGQVWVAGLPEWEFRAQS